MSGRDPLTAKNNFVENLNERIEQALVNGPPLKVSGQNWGLIIVIGPENCAQRNVKYVQVLLGVFDTEEECDEHVQKLWRLDYQWFDIHKVPMYTTLPFPPNTKPEKVKYIEEEMNSIMLGYKKQEVYAQRAIQDRIMADREQAAQTALAKQESKEESKEESKDN